VPKSASPSPGGKNFREINGDFTGTAEDAKAAFQQGLSEIGASTVSLNILAADTTESKSIAEYLKNQLETNLEGLEIKISVQPLQRRLELEKAIDYDISISTYVPLNSDPISYLEMFETDGNFNRMGYSNPRYDELVTQAKAELDMEKRYDLMLEAEKILFEDAAIAPLYQSADSIVQKPYVKDFVSYPAMPQHGYKWVKIEGK
jgi:oligopeptide transport system substrate-binding protein